MENLMSRTTLYDMLSMIVPGFITLLSLVVIYTNCFGVPEMFKPEGCCSGGTGLIVAIYVCVFALSYLVGMLVHRVSQLAFDRFIRNKVDCTKAAKEDFERTLKEKGEEDTKEYDGKDFMEAYYERYYVAAHYPFSALPAIESQVSFIRSMFFVILLVCVAICCVDKLETVHRCCAVAFLLILDVISVIHMFEVQKKIHFRVYEDSYYMKLIKGGWKGDVESRNGSSVAYDKDTKSETHSHEDSKKSMTKPKK